jgi:hypothetical protein
LLSFLPEIAHRLALKMTRRFTWNEGGAQIAKNFSAVSYYSRVETIELEVTCDSSWVGAIVRYDRVEVIRDPFIALRRIISH